MKHAARLAEEAILRWVADNHAVCRGVGAPTRQRGERMIAEIERVMVAIIHWLAWFLSPIIRFFDWLGRLGPWLTESMSLRR